MTPTITQNVQILDPRLVSKMLPKCAIFGPRWPREPKRAPREPKAAPRAHKRDPRKPQEGPKKDPREPQESPRQPKESPRQPREGPRRPKTAQDSPKRDTREPKTAPSCARRALKVHSRWGWLGQNGARLLQCCSNKALKHSILSNIFQDGPKMAPRWPKMLHFSLELLWTFVLGHLGPLCLYLRIVFTALSFRLRFDFLVLLFCICFASPFLFQWQGFPNNKPSIGQHN